jgi:hypothetical protein
MKTNNSKSLQENDMRPEYDFTGGVRGKHAKAYNNGHSVTIHKTDGTSVVEHFMSENNIIVLEEDVQEYFPDSETVNRALRSLISLIPKKAPEQHDINVC